MDGQNFQNDQVTENTQTEQSAQQNYYQDNTAASTPQYTQNPAGVPEKKTDALAIVSLVLGILSILLACCSYIALLPGIPGIICAILSKKQNGKSGLATAGLVCSIVGIVLGIIMTILGVLGVAILGDGLSNLYNY